MKLRILMLGAGVQSSNGYVLAWESTDNNSDSPASPNNFICCDTFNVSPSLDTRPVMR